MMFMALSQADLRSTLRRPLPWQTELCCFWEERISREEKYLAEG